MRTPLLGFSLLLLTLSVVFGFLNNSKVKSLRLAMENAVAARSLTEKAHAAQQKEMRQRKEKAATVSAKFAETEKRMASVEAELIKSQSEKASLQTRLQTNGGELSQLRTRLAELTARSPGTRKTAGPSAAELQTQLEETRQQLDEAEREKTLLSERVRERDESSPVVAERSNRRKSALPAGLRGTVMAVNQAYNFVVLNLGSRQGVEPNSEMLVLRRGTLIGKIRVSSVEPATAIGDIMSSSLARGVQVQPGDIVIYAGANF